MVRIIYCHPRQTRHDYHIFVDLDFWDARRLLKDLAVVKRNFGKHPDGDEFPTQIVADSISRSVIAEIEKRLRKAIISPPRHVIVRSMILNGHFEFDPLRYYPARWSKNLMMHFTYHRLPLQQSALSTPFQTVRLSWVENRIRVDKIQREEMIDPVIRTPRQARERLAVPSCF
jgi:hypothetical protein